LKQCVEALDYILTKTSRAPENVYLGGDSAGANVALSVLLHISHHPHPSLVDQDENNSNNDGDNEETPHRKTYSLVDSDSYLGGIVCLSPWVDFDFDRPSEHANRGRDCISIKSELAWANSYTGHKPFDAWSEPALAPAEWWKGVRVRDFLVLAGSDEILLSGIGGFADKVQVCLPLRRKRNVFSN
jgi:acetyl esterase/lipase